MIGREITTKSKLFRCFSSLYCLRIAVGIVMMTMTSLVTSTTMAIWHWPTMMSRWPLPKFVEKWRRMFHFTSIVVFRIIRCWSIDLDWRSTVWMKAKWNTLVKLGWKCWRCMRFFERSLPIVVSFGSFMWSAVRTEIQTLFSKSIISETSFWIKTNRRTITLK